MTSRAVVLVVEDEEYLRTTMCAAFTLVGFLPVSAGTVEEALKILGTEPVHAIVLDVRLPDPGGSHRSGLNLLQYVRETPEHAQLPVLVFTGMPLTPHEEELVRANKAHLFYKPQQYAVLIDQLARLLDV